MRNADSFPQWGYGVRVCIGKNIALLEMLKLIPLMVMKYDLELVNSTGKLKTVTSIVTRVEGFKCRIKKRV